ncbi:MAG: alpha/beta fold hydrolase [Planctomycetota bacterium]
MNSILRTAVFVAAFGAALPGPCAQTAAGADADPLVGTWFGTITAGGRDLEVALHFTRDGDRYRATLDSITQGAEGIPVASAEFDGDRLELDVSAIRASYSAIWQEGPPAQLTGTWTQSGVDVDLDMTKRSAEEVEASKLKRPQEPKPPFPYAVEDGVRFGHDPASSVEDSFRADDGGEVTLAGTLTLPAGDGPHPAVVMISGSGPQDRDETVFRHKPFWIIADHLTRRGIAVLRYDDRGTHESTGSFKQATSADFADDVRAAVRYLATRDEIDAARIGLIGHSEGGLIAPMVASGPDAERVAFAVLLAPPAVNIRDVIRHQSRLIAATESDVNREDVDVNDELLRAVFTAIETHADDATARTAAIEAAATSAWEALSPEGQASSGKGPDDLVARTGRLNTPWVRYLLDHDPTESLTAMRCPVLAMFGGKDLQVDPGQNLEPLRQAFGKSSVEPTITVLDGHNHLFQRTETGAPGEYVELEETFSPQALDVLTTWLDKHALGR